MVASIVDEIERAKYEGINLYLCGVEHLGRNVLSLSKIVEAVEPNIILLESRTPNSKYFRGETTGEFVKEMKFLNVLDKPMKYHQTPNLREIKESVDSIGAMVKGLDIPVSSKTMLLKKYTIQDRRLISVYETLQNKVHHLLDTKPKKLQTLEYRQMEELSDRLYQDKPYRCGNDFNRFTDGCKAIFRIVSSYPELHKFFTSAVRRLNKIGSDIYGYHKERDSAMFNNLIAEYDGQRKFLVAIGSSHLEDLPFIQLIDKYGIPHLKFSIYKGPRPV